MPAEQYNIGCYLLDRMVQVGCGHLFGVPGDYNLRFLDDVMALEKAGKLKWVGCANELNAAYAADGYGKLGRMGALLTTYGVGEISALNGIAGAMAESSPVLHIVGGPSISDENKRLIMHHTLGEGNFRDFTKMSENLSCALACLTPENAKREIDRVIQQVCYHKKPGFLLLPLDVAVLPCGEPTSSLSVPRPPVNEVTVLEFQSHVERLMSESKSAALIGGYLCERHGASELVERMVQETNMPFSTVALGKGCLDESLPQYIGSYSGKGSAEEVLRIQEGAHVSIQVGVKFTDLSSGLFSQSFDANRVIDIQPFDVAIGDKYYAEVPMLVAVEIVHTVAKKYCSNWPQTHPKPSGLPASKDPNTFDAFHFWREIEENLAPGDIVLADQGSSCCAAQGMFLPAKCTLICQALWASIGYTLPAALGAQLAAPSRRVVLLVGDGAAQMTIQELGTFVRNGLSPVIFLMSNQGYVIERVIHGFRESYNNIAPWNYLQIVGGLTDNSADIATLEQIGETKKVLQDTRDSRTQLVFREVKLGRYELPVHNIFKH